MAARKLRIDQLRGAARTAAENALKAGKKKAPKASKLMPVKQVEAFAKKLKANPRAAEVYRRILSK